MSTNQTQSIHNVNIEVNPHTLSKFYQEHRYNYRVDGNLGALERIVRDLNTIILHSGEI